MKCPTCGAPQAQPGTACPQCRAYIPKSAAARAAAYDIDSDLDDDELYEAPPNRRQRVLGLVFKPLDFEARPERGDILPFCILALVIGAALGLPGLLLGSWLTDAEQKAWGSMSPNNSHYPSFQKYFMLPAIIGLMIAFSGLYRSLLVGWPWLGAGSTGAHFARFGVAIVLLSGTAVLGLALLMMMISR
ncbi:hypothetical protein [Hyalangium versicolor]|uniref:hypothetical protein n=1 Tax=Hyalangium versicolor TaxID=2861190 RepID=UPI001CCAEE14|nr:hypothetical protein [Hyalangium versicolor]